MAINDLTTGVGTLAHVAWTPLDGTGLSAAQTTSVSSDVKAALAMAKALLEAANSAFNVDWIRFSLNDLAAPNGLAGGTYLTRTNLRVSTAASPTDDTPGDWAAFIGRALGSAPATDQARSLGDWRRLAADLQRFAALQASRRDGTWGVAGGVTHAHGQWYANGQALSLLDLFTAARVNQVANHDDALDGFMSDLEANNRRLTAAREWGRVLSKGDHANTLSSSERNSFKAKWGFDPITFHKTPVIFDSAAAEGRYNTWRDELKVYIDTMDADNQILQQKLQQKQSRRSEVLEAMVSFAASQSKTGGLMAGNLG